MWNETKDGCALLINLGAPESTDVKAVRTYLQRILADPYRFDKGWLARLSRPFIAYRIGPSLAREYQRHGLVYGPCMTALAQAVEKECKLPVRIATRYGTPSIEQVVDELPKLGIRRIFVIPLYPQYSKSLYDSIIDALGNAIESTAATLEQTVSLPYWEDNEYLMAFAAHMRTHMPSDADSIVFSFHSIPKHHSARDTWQGRDYESQCICFARRVMEYLPGKSHRVAFQSAMGQGWLGPSLKSVVAALPGFGHSKIVVVRPSIAVDCLDSVNDIESLQAHFKTAGGDSIHFVPCLNNSPHWCTFLARQIQKWDQVK